MHGCLDNKKKNCKRSRVELFALFEYTLTREYWRETGAANANARNKGMCRSEGVVKTARNEGRDFASEKDQWVSINQAVEG